MFNFFKKPKFSKVDKLTALIRKQTTFSVKALDLHKKLRAAAPDEKEALFEAFLFNNWASFHLITRELCAALPASATQSDVAATRADIAKRIIGAAHDEAALTLEKIFGICLSDYSENDFTGYASETFSDYDRSVSSHQTPAWLSAAIHLGVCAQLPLPDFSNLQRAMEAKMEIQKEAGQIFSALDDLIRDDVQDYVRTK